jgi:hypothetical protein
MTSWQNILKDFIKKAKSSEKISYSYPRSYNNFPILDSSMISKYSKEEFESLFNELEAISK